MIKRKVIREPFPLREMYFWLFASALAIVIVGLLSSCNAVHLLNQSLSVDDDNIVEEFVEEVIQVETGIPVDLTPETTEK